MGTTARKWLGAVVVLCLLPAGVVRAGESGAVKPFLDEQTIAVLRLQPGKLDVAALLDRLAAQAKLDEDTVGEAKKEWAGWLKGLHAAGAKEVFVVASLDDVPDRPPFVVVPLEKESAANKVAGVVGRLHLLDRSMTVEKVGSALVLASRATHQRLKKQKPGSRPDVVEALAGAGPARLVMVPTRDAARILEETMPALPEEVGGGSIKPLSRGLKGVTLDLETMPKPELRLTVRAADSAAAKALDALIRRGLKTLAGNKDLREAMPALVELFALWKPQLLKDRLVLRLDEKTLARVGRPLLLHLIETERRTRVGGQMRRLLKALLDYHDKTGTFPAPSSRDKDGKPLLSWRVHLLPYLGEAALYKEFKLDEPWDSPHNKKLISRMPAVYRPAISKRTPETHTTFLAPLGEATMFPPGGGRLRISDVIDGIEQTIMLVDVRSNEAIVWTRPVDLPYDAKNPLAGLSPRHGGQIMVGMVDGTVHFLSQTIDKETMAALFTRNGREAVTLP
jgi:hypothetical protein